MYTVFQVTFTFNDQDSGGCIYSIFNDTKPFIRSKKKKKCNLFFDGRSLLLVIQSGSVQYNKTAQHICFLL